MQWLRDWRYSTNMQHTLLPHNEKRALKKEYHSRELIVFLFMISFATLIGIGSLLPGFVNAKLDHAATEKSLLEAKQNEKAEVNGLQKDFATNQKLLAALSGPGDLKYTPLVESLVAMRQQNTLSTISITKTSTTTIDILMNGVAPTRAALMAFKKKLEADPTAKVDLPISALAKSTNIQFSIHVTKKIQ